MIVAAMKFVTESDGVWIEVAVTVPAVMLVAESAGVCMFDVAVMVAAMMFVALKAGVCMFDVAVTVAPVRFVAETVPAIPRLPEASR